MMTVREARKRAIRDAIRATADAKGTVTPDGVVAAARDPANPLHSEFEWDDAEAAHKHRLSIARHLIRTIEYVVEHPDEPEPHSFEYAVPDYVHDPRLEVGDQGYIPLDTVARNRRLKAMTLAAELDRCESILKRARGVADTLRVELEIDVMLEALARSRRLLRDATGYASGDEAHPS